jgi:ribosomal protein S18 acetylase RimI-like enzyme
MMIEKWNGFEITDFEEEDFEPLAELFRDVYVKTYPHFDPKFFRLERFRTILRASTLPKAAIQIARKEGKIVGFIALEQNFIDQLYIHENFQGQGLGGFWVERVKTIYPEFLELYTFASNEEAIAFYEKHGFQIIERAVAPDEKMPDVKMRWESAN